jgi:hypothetical protein
MAPVMLALVLAQSKGINAADRELIAGFSSESAVPGWLPKGFELDRMNISDRDVEPGIELEFRVPGGSKSLTVQTASGGIGDLMLMGDDGAEARQVRLAKGRSPFLGTYTVESGIAAGRRLSIMNWVNVKKGRLRFVSALGDGVEMDTFQKFVANLRRIGS